MNTQRARDEHLLDAWRENEAKDERIRQLETALEIALRDCDHYRTECVLKDRRVEHMEQQLMEYRVQDEEMAREFEDEVDTLVNRRSKAASRIRARQAKAEMAPYTNGEKAGFFRNPEDGRPLAIREMN